MSDTRNRPREGPMAVSREPLPPLLWDNWAVCSFPGCGLSERDGAVWRDYARASYRCENGHEVSSHDVLWEVQAR